MQIIVLHHNARNARSLTLTLRHILLAMALFLVSVVMGSSLLYYLTFRHATNLPLALMRDAVASATEDEAGRRDKHMRENLAAMAMKLGEMQAQLMRLDALGERVQGLSGVKPQEFSFRQPTVPAAAPVQPLPPTPLELGAFQKSLDALARDVEYRADYMSAVESALVNSRTRSRLLPTIAPVNVGYRASGFGWRLDPFTGHTSFHEGIDFAAPTGTPIVAAAGGVVVTAQFHPQFGNMIEIDHGNEIVTRYAHASRLLAAPGAIVKRGQHIADIGSTGRSTGPHLHFEVLVRGERQNPQKFLAAGADHARLAALSGT